MFELNPTYLKKVVEVKRVRVSQTFKVPILECKHKARMIVDNGRVREHYFCFCCLRKANRNGNHTSNPTR